MEFLVPVSILSTVATQPKSSVVSYHSTDAARTVVDHIEDLMIYAGNQRITCFSGVVDHTIGLWHRPWVPLKEGT